MVLLSFSLPPQLLSLQRYLSTTHTGPGGHLWRASVAAMACRVNIRLSRVAWKVLCGLLWSAASASLPSMGALGPWLRTSPLATLPRSVRPLCVLTGSSFCLV